MKAFDQLTLAEKFRMIKLAGEQLTTIKFPEYSVSLYHIDEILIEHYIENTTQKTIRINSVGYLEMLKYLPHISIRSLKSVYGMLVK